MTAAYLAVLGLSYLVRLIELDWSRHNQRLLAGRGVRPALDSGFAAMVVLHSVLPAAAGIEVLALDRPLYPELAIPMLVLLILAHALRWWVIATLREHWNVQLMDSLELGVVTGGPYRWVRHPNYVAVFVELAALPLAHTAWMTAVFGTLAHIAVLRQRIRSEERVLHKSPAYLSAMAHKPRFVPRLRPAEAPVQHGGR